VDFVDGNIVPETGPAGTFTRASSRTYADGTAATDLTLATSGNPAVEGFFYNPSGGTVGGVHIAGAAKNWALHSEDLSNAAWVATNVTKSTSSMVQPDGDTASTDVATATANNGEVMQDLGETAASTHWSASMFVKCPSGTVAGKLRVRGSGGTPEEVTTAFTATTTWQRVIATVNEFTAGATGNVNVGFSIDTNAEVLHVWGLMAEKTKEGTYGMRGRRPKTYITTGAATAVTANDLLYYPSSVINPTEGTIMGFWYPLITGADASQSNPAFVSMSNTLLSVYHTTLVILAYNGGTFVGAALTSHVWQHLAYTWKQNGANFDLKLYENGVLHSSGSVTKAALTPVDLYIGSRLSLQRLCSEGPISRLKVFNEALELADIGTYFDNDKADYGL
jgi:hypothetical protein